MIHKSENGVLTLTLGPDCTIAEVEAHADRLRSQVWDVQRVELNAQALESIDTAYLQLLLSLRATLEDSEVSISLSGASSVLDEALKWFGILKDE